jgi:hypothetical protein
LLCQFHNVLSVAPVYTTPAQTLLKLSSVCNRAFQWVSGKFVRNYREVFRASIP